MSKFLTKCYGNGKRKMANNVIKSTAITAKAYEIALSVANKRKSEGLSSSITAVISEAVIEKFGKECQSSEIEG